MGATATTIVNVDEEKTVSQENEQQQEEESANGFGVFGDIDIVDATVEDREDDSSFVDSDIIDNGYQSNNVDAVQVNKEEIDGALLNKLGVPLDYNEQNQLATMIVENRQIEQEQNDTTALEEEDQNEEREQSAENDEEKQATISDADLSPIGPDDVLCENCGKYINKMSFMMHEMHCRRQFMRCKVCNEVIKRSEEELHHTNVHREFTCICSKICVGKLAFDAHQVNECELRLMSCKYCELTNIPFLEFAEHESQCKESTVACEVCGEEYIRKNKHLHTCGSLCVLCGDRVNVKDKLLHLLTDCRERRAVCNYCGIFRKCVDMEEHRQFCGSRSEQCEVCNKFVSIANMEAHLASNCELYSNKQLSNIGKTMKKRKKKKKDADNEELDGAIAESMRSMGIQENDLSNPYIDASVLNNNAVQEDQSLFGLLKSNPCPTMVDTSFAMEAMQSSAMNKQLCPHCSSSDLLMDEEEFQIHIATMHPQLINDSMTQAVFASFANPDILSGAVKSKKKIKKNKRKLATDTQQAKRQKRARPMKSWNCPQCTFANTTMKCAMCRTSRPK